MIEILVELIINLLLYLILFGILGLIIYFILCLTGLDTDDDNLWKFIKKCFNKPNTDIVIGSRWCDNKYEIIKIKQEFPEDMNIDSIKNYRTEKDKVTMIYLRDTRYYYSNKIYKYEISEFKKWFRK